MTLMRRNPWTLFEEFNRMFPAMADDDSRVVGSRWSPAVDIKEEDERFLITADIPGVAPEDIDISMENGVLTIKGERKHESEEEKEGYHRIEREHGTFMRRFALPENVDAEQIAATSKDGVVELTLPKTEEKTEEPKRIEVH